MNRANVREDSLDLKKLFFQYLPYWYWFVICLAVIFPIAWLANRITEPVYELKSTVLIKEDYPYSPQISFMRELEMFGSGSNWFNETAILQSYSLIDTVLHKMDLDVSYYNLGRIFGSLRRTEMYNDAPFRVFWDRNSPQPYGHPITFTVIDQNTYELIETNGLQGLREKQPYQFGDTLKGPDYSFIIDFVVPYSENNHRDRTYQFVINNVSNLVPVYLAGLNVEPLGVGFSIVEITFQATNQQRASEFLNTLADTYIKLGLNEKNQTARNTIEFIDEQIALTSESLSAAESDLQQFRQERQLMDVSFQATQLLNEFTLLDRQRSVEQVKRQYYELLQEYVTDERDFSEVFGPSSLGIEDQMLNALLGELSKMYSERARMLMTSTERSPNVLAIDRNIKRAKTTLEETIRSVKSASDIVLDDLNTRIRQLERRINELPRTDRQLVSIQRLFNLSDATYNYLLEKSAEAGIALASNQPDHKVVDKARFSKQVAPKKRFNYVVAFTLGLALPFLLITVRNFFNTRIVDKNEITNALEFSILGVIPHHKQSGKEKKKTPLIFEHSRAPMVEAFRTMRSNLQFFSAGSRNKIIVVTSTRSREGKTFTAQNLAGALAIFGKKTVVIGADMRKPRLHKDLEIAREPGLSNYLIGASRIEDVVQPVKYNENLHAVASGPIPPNPAELLGSPAMDTLLNQLSGFDYIIIDTPPLGQVSDALPLLTKATICLYVIRHNYTERSALEFINEFTKKTNTKNLVISINDVKLNQRESGYGYGIGYNYEEEDQENRRFLKRKKRQTSLLVFA